jgi:hypothetical protein
LTQQVDSPTPSPRQAGEESTGVPHIEVTPEMIEDGVLTAREHCLGAPLADLVTNVYIAMVSEVR